MNRKLGWGTLVGAAVTLVTLVGGALGILQALGPPHDLTGKWTIIDKTEQTSYSPYQDLQVTYVVTITQEGTDLSGSGYKSAESGHPLFGKAQTPIEIKGKLKGLRGNSIDAAFTEQGAKRPVAGGFNWKLARDGKWAGTFYSGAADSSGSSTLSR